MNNVLLGKIMKIMYKLSGKTLPQLAEETGLTVDTINNVFYARIQKPGFFGVNALVEAMGFSIQQLMGFLTLLANNPGLTGENELTEALTNYIENAEAAGTKEKNTRSTVAGTISGGFAKKDSNGTVSKDRLDYVYEMQRESVEQLQNQYREQLDQMKESSMKLEKQYERAIDEIKLIQTEERMSMRKAIGILGTVLGVETVLIVLLVIIDLLNAGIGWFR